MTLRNEFRQVNYFKPQFFLCDNLQCSFWHLLEQYATLLHLEHLSKLFTWTSTSLHVGFAHRASGLAVYIFIIFSLSIPVRFLQSQYRRKASFHSFVWCISWFLVISQCKSFQYSVLSLIRISQISTYISTSQSYIPDILSGSSEPRIDNIDVFRNSE